NEAIILPDGQQVLDEVIDVLAKNPQIRKVSVEGHTDNAGTPEKNLLLSKRRAAAVVAYMVKNGIAPDRLTSEGYGQSKPLVPKPGSNTRGRFSSGMPRPLSPMEMRARSPSRAVESTMRPPRPGSIAWQAFTRRFMNTWWIWLGWHSTGGRAP